MRLRRAVAAGFACLSVLAACTSDSEEPETITISVWVSGDPAETQAFADVAESFEASQDGIKVDLARIAERDDLIARLSTSFAGGEPPDVFLMNYRYLGQFESKGALEPLEPYLASSDAFSAEDFFPEAMAPFGNDGVQTCMPQNASSLVTYYNRDLFDQAGVGFPEDDWTWDDMVAAATALTTDTDGDGSVDVYGLGVDPEIIRVAPFVWSAGGDLVDDPTRPTRFAIDTVKAARPIQAFLDLRAVAGVTPTDEEAESADFETRFLDGTLAMLMESRRVVPSLRTIEDFEWDVAPLPMHREAVSILHSDAYCMTTASDHQQEAWAFLEFALGPEGQRIAAATGRTVPSLREIAESEAFLDPSQAPANSQVFLDAIPTLQAVPSIETWPEIEDVVNGLLEEAYYDPAGAGEAGELILAIVDQTSALFDRANTG